MHTQNGLVGDVYIAIAKSGDHPIARQLHEDGLVFVQTHRKVEFPDDVTMNGGRIADCSLVIDPSINVKYYDLIPKAMHYRCPFNMVRPIGVFIPNGQRKLKVANDLRRRFGLGTILLRPSPSMCFCRL